MRVEEHSGGRRGLGGARRKTQRINGITVKPGDGRKKRPRCETPLLSGRVTLGRESRGGKIELVTT